MFDEGRSAGEGLIALVAGESFPGVYFYVYPQAAFFSVSFPASLTRELLFCVLFSVRFQVSEFSECFLALTASELVIRECIFLFR